MMIEVNTPVKGTSDKVKFDTENGISFGDMTLSFYGLPDARIVDVIKDFDDFKRKIAARLNGALEPSTTLVATPPAIKEKKTTIAKTKVARSDKTFPRSDIKLSSWAYKLIKLCPDVTSLKREFRKKFPKYSDLPDENLEKLWEYYHQKAAELEKVETPAPRTEEDPKPGQQIGKNSKVVQIKGVSPAIGIGTVLNETKNGLLKVQFFNHIKVLTKDHFALATEADVRNAARMANHK